MITLEKENDQKYYVLWENGKQIGTFIVDVDGMFYFWDESNSYGSWSAYQLRAIADKLDEINKPFKEIVDEYFDQERDYFEKRAEKGYEEVLKSGMFWEWYPQLTGNWERDKSDWFIIYTKIEKLRQQNSAF